MIVATTDSAGPWVTMKEAPAAVRFLLLGVAINQFGAFLQAFLVLYLVHRGFSSAQAGFALGGYGIGAVTGVLLGGALTDRLTPRLTIIVSMVWAAVFTLAVTFLGSYPAIVVVVVLAGVMTQAYRPAAAALLTGMVPKSRQVMIMAMNRLAMNVGIMVGPLAAAALVTISWNLIFWVDATTSLLCAAVAVVLLPSVRPTATPEADETAEPGMRANTGYRAMFADRRYVIFLSAMLTNALVHIQLFAALPLTLHDAGFPTVVYSIVITVGVVVMVSSELQITKVTQHWPAYRAGALGSLLLGLGLVGYGLPGGIVMIVAATVFNEVGQMIGGPTVFAWPAKAAPPGLEGRYLGSALATFGLGQALGPVLGVFIYQHIGRNFWWLCGAMGVVSAITAGYSMRPQSTVAGVSAEVAAAEMPDIEPSELALVIAAPVLASASAEDGRTT